MISLIQSIVSPEDSSVSTKSASLSALVTQGNIIVVVGVYSLIQGSVLTVSDSLANIYTIHQPISDTLGGSYWFAYAVSQSTGSFTITATYSVSVNNSSFTVVEFFNSIGWVNPPEVDGESSVNGNGVSLSSGPLITSNLDDLIVSLSSATSSLTNTSAWSFISQQSLTLSVWWISSTSSELIPPFTSTQTISGNWSVETWALQANVFSPDILSIITSSVNPTAFIEVYPNRVKEDIYDSLEGQSQFVYIQYGPSILNG